MSLISLSAPSGVPNRARRLRARLELKLRAAVRRNFKQRSTFTSLSTRTITPNRCRKPIGTTPL
jgi:hypothetical protein